MECLIAAVSHGLAVALAACPKVEKQIVHACSWAVGHSEGAERLNEKYDI